MLLMVTRGRSLLGGCLESGTRILCVAVAKARSKARQESAAGGLIFMVIIIRGVVIGWSLNVKRKGL